MKDVLVTGAYGGMGSAAVKELTRRGYRVFALITRWADTDAALKSPSTRL